MAKRVREPTEVKLPPEVWHLIFLACTHTAKCLPLYRQWHAWLQEWSVDATTSYSNIVPEDFARHGDDTARCLARLPYTSPDHMIALAAILHARVHIDGTQAPRWLVWHSYLLNNMHHWNKRVRTKHMEWRMGDVYLLIDRGHDYELLSSVVTRHILKHANRKGLTCNTNLMKVQHGNQPLRCWLPDQVWLPKDGPVEVTPTRQDIPARQLELRLAFSWHAWLLWDPAKPLSRLYDYLNRRYALQQQLEASGLVLARELRAILPHEVEACDS